jgi:hypothetical protein
MRAGCPRPDLTGMEDRAPDGGTRAEDRVSGDRVAWAAAESEAPARGPVAACPGRRPRRRPGSARRSTARIVTNLLTAAHLHDLGYSPSLSVTGFHQLDGGACSSTRS